MRLSYVDNPPNFTNEDDKATLERVKARRGEKGLLPLDLALLHAPKVADGWNSLLGAIRGKTSLPDNIREIAICRPALINQAWFEWKHHAPLLQDSESFKASPDKFETVQQLHPTSAGSLDKREWATLRYADAMTRDVKVSQSLFDEVKALFSEQEVVEITTTVASYNLVSRFLVALDVGEMNDQAPEFTSQVTNPTSTDDRIQS
ncbi:hypothetical protein LTS08_003181 [Lithohypha guttulata]|uniref:Carboxymuconolactone decarboxylase-like domain-containing protein n=1 Tax=Lithohypha guttulata TaxID=1690604 RepID=A0AAN7SZ35_9EURO|nr:hypothetical protein LTR05_004640 [Lithohypha guttulata]KAK5103762.1 hypothetical protein LTS08_003181 [Lithohypha guttulata]